MKMEEFQGEMRDMQEQLWQAGKYGTVGLVVLTTLPVFLPSMLVLSALFFTFLLPLVCGVAGFFYVLKYVAMVYHFRSGIRSHRSYASSAWGVSCVRRYAIFRSGIFLLLEFFRKDTDQIDLLETDHEYDCHTILADSKKPRGRRVKPETSTRTEQFESSREREFPKGEATVVFQTQADRQGKVVETVFVHSGACHASEMIRFIFSGEREDLGVASVSNPKSKLIDSCTEPSKQSVHRLRQKKKLGGDESMEVSKGRIERLTSADSCLLGSEGVIVDRDRLNLSPVTSSGQSGPESMTLDYTSLEMFRPDEDESASEEEAFKLVANELVPFGARKLRSKSVVPTEEAQWDLRSRPSRRGTESDDDDDGQSDRTIDSSCPFERFSRHPSISCREPSPSEERLGMVRSWRSSSTFSDDSMCDSDEERRVQQLTSLSGNRCIFREGQSEANVIWYYNVFADLT